MISIEPKAKTDIDTDAISAYPFECCGFMFGVEDQKGNRQVTEVMIVNNSSVENRERRFRITPTDYLKAEQYADEKGLTLLGVYHSHPDHPAIPSEHDRVAAQPWFSYIIVSVRKEEIADIRSWVLNDNLVFDEETISHPINIINQ
jgi:proteasome lid subunit RPN8/RPN11